VPYPPDKGDRIRTYHWLRFLAARASVYLVCCADEPVADDALRRLGELCKQVAVVPLGGLGRWLRAGASFLRGRTITAGAFYSGRVPGVIARWSQETSFQAAIASSSGMAPYLRAPEIRDVPAVVDFIDVDSQKWLDYAAAHRSWRRWLYQVEGRRLRAREKDILNWARAVTLVTEAEVGLFRTFSAAGSVCAIENGVDLDYFQPGGLDEPDRCVFVGALDYSPNEDAVCWFTQEVWPEIQRQRPSAKFSIVGRRPSPRVCRLRDRPGIDLVGQVADVRPYLARAAVVVAPLRIARGVQNKILEALAMGKATVASPPALEGLGLQSGVHALSATSVGDWQESVLRLFADGNLRQQLGSAGRRYVLEHHRWDRCLEPLESLLGLSRPPPQVAAEPCPAPAGTMY
jgi:sugar transferase (PEP-CTERM/EpsH1 system associated)